MLFDNFLLGTTWQGYIAGANDGILTRNGTPAASDIILFDVMSLAVLYRTASLSNGHYMLVGLEPTKKYLVMARDYNKEYEPAVWDYVTPATDLTVAQQQELWQSWQTST